MKKVQNGIPCDPELANRLRFLSDKTGRPQIQILRELIGKMTEIAISFEDFGYWVHDLGSEITITFYGRSRMANGRIVDPSCLTDAENEILDEVAMQNDIKAKLLSDNNKTTRTEVTQKVAKVEGDLGIPKKQKIKVRLVP